MSLFGANRYTGEEDEIEAQNENHLSTLLQKIEERKRLRTTNNNEEETTLPKKKKKKTKNENLNTEEDINKNDENSTTIEVSEVPKKKKKKKDKDQENPSVKLENDDNNQNSIIHNTNYDDSTNIDTNDKNTNESKDAKTDQLEKDKKSENCAFTILSKGKQFKTKAVKRVLPQWLAHPNIIPSDLESGLNLDENNCGLDEIFVTALKCNGVEKLFPVQSTVIPWLLECNNKKKSGVWVRDTCICAPTGSGKTLVYVLPILQILNNRFVRRVRCLIILPVQELAAQVFKVLQTYAAYTKLDVGLISGACPFAEDQKKILRKRSNGEYVSLVDILVATPGRLIDHIKKTEGFSLEYLQFLVIDEADRSTDWLQHIPVPHSRPPPLTLENFSSSEIPPAQKILLSATLSQDPEKISRLGLFRPILFTTVAFSKDEDIDLDKLQEETISRFTIPEKLTVRLVESPAEYKPLAVMDVLTKSEEIGKTLIFTNSGNSAHRLCILLQIMLTEKNIQVKELSSQLTPRQREETLNNFANSKFKILVCSDALTRGLDIPGVTMVISYDPPKYIKGHIHRIGRTGRAGLPGTAVSIITPNQMELFSQMLKSSHLALPEVERTNLEQLAEACDYSSHLEKLKTTLDKEQEKLKKKVKAIKRKH